MIKLGLFIIDSSLLPSYKDNQFLEITDSRLGIHVNSEVMIGGVYRKIKNVMICNKHWINQNYLEPIEYYTIYRLPKKNNENCCESFCKLLSCFECCLDTCCKCCDCECGSYCKRTCCIIIIIILIIIILIPIINP